MKKKLILIAGPTASGKTKTSVLLAKRIGGEIISCDSMQVYKGMDIGTAKVTQSEMEGIPHYMIDLLDPKESSNIAWFKNEVNKAIDHITAKGKIPILVGGTGFYLNAILFDTQFDETKEDTTYRKELEALVEVHGNKFLHEKLEKVDPASAQAIHPNNVKRVIRALEYYTQTGHPISSHNEVEKEKRQAQVSPYEYAFFALDMDRATLYNRINTRVDQMMTQGLVEEVKYFYDLGLTEEMTSMKGIGYKEFFPYFKGTSSLEACTEQLKQNTRHFAKRQLTWFRHQSNPIFIAVDALDFNAEKIVDEMIKHLENILV